MTDDADSGATSRALVARGVTRSFSGLAALSDVTLELHRHQVVGLLGPNGAGKSTLVNLLTGFDRPTSGQILLDGVDITAWSPARRAAAGLGRTFQHGHSFAGLPVEENVEVAALGVGTSPAEARRRGDELLDLLGIGHRRGTPAGALPHGEERLLGVARALATLPRFVLLDEPAAGLNEDEADQFGDVVRLIRDERGVGVLLIDHNISLVFEVSDHVHVLDQGRTLAEGSAGEIRGHGDVLAAYLGHR